MSADGEYENDSEFKGWVILELMGHRRLIGYLSTQELAGHSYLRIDALTDPPSTQFYAPAAVYCITPTTGETARQAARLNHIAPVQRWELPAPPAAGEAALDDDDEDDEDDGSPWPR
jgi:hypothetical protein